MEKLAFLTGSSRGIGLNTLNSLLASGWEVYGFARTAPSLIHSKYKHFTVDLSDAEATQKIFQECVREIPNSNIERIALINNAGLLKPTGDLSGHDLNFLKDSFCVNVAVPMWISHFILKSFPNIPAVVINLSSGAATKPYAGWSFYCASKAALRMAAQVLAEDLPILKRKAKTAIVLYAPGVVDTAMQKQVRQEKAEDFPAVERFKQLHESGQLVAGTEPAAEICAFCDLDFQKNLLIEERYPSEFLQRNP